MGVEVAEEKEQGLGRAAKMVSQRWGVERRLNSGVGKASVEKQGQAQGGDWSEQLRLQQGRVEKGERMRCSKEGRQ